MSKSYQMCNRCVMDTTAANITFDEQGRCDYCTDFLRVSAPIIDQSDEHRNIKLQSLISKIKSSRGGRRYDCIVGVSGGVDSSWTLVHVVKLGLRPLAVHMDNGWNSELAQSNIKNLVTKLEVDLHTHVIDWMEYRGLMQSFFDADVVDVELLYDNAMIAVNYRMAKENKLRFILAGTNQSTEGMRMPVNWNWHKRDKRNIVALAKKFGNIKLKTFPSFGTVDHLWYAKVLGIKWTSFLDFLNYNKSDAMDILQRDYQFKPYPYKHYESVFTRFYQGYILPNKFSVDKRRLHFSSLILSGQMTREAALIGLEGIAYPSVEHLEQDKQYFLKKMGWNQSDLESYIKRPPVSHSEYPSEKNFWDFCMNMRSSLRGLTKMEN